MATFTFTVNLSKQIIKTDPTYYYNINYYIVHPLMFALCGIYDFYNSDSMNGLQLTCSTKVTK